MKIEFDEDKDLGNARKHGVPLSYAGVLIWDMAEVWMDKRFRYDELRMEALLPDREMRLFHVAFVERSDVLRVMRLRKANRHEKDAYAACRGKNL